MKWAAKITHSYRTTYKNKKKLAKIYNIQSALELNNCLKKRTREQYKIHQKKAASNAKYV